LLKPAYPINIASNTKNTIKKKKKTSEINITKSKKKKKIARGSECVPASTWPVAASNARRRSLSAVR
jgi:hypothetical protein